jgi:type I restriction enzyme S subunit
MVSLKDIIQKPITGEWGSDGEGIKVIRTTNFTNQGVLNLDKIVSRDVSENKIAQKKLQKGDVIIEKSGGSPTQPVGRVIISQQYLDLELIKLSLNIYIIFFLQVISLESQKCFKIKLRVS